jgi:osmotically inducible protein OsmC
LSACYENAILRMARQSGTRFADPDVEVIAEIGIRRNDSDALALSVKLEGALAGIDQAKAEELAHRTDAICPYAGIRTESDSRPAQNDVCTVKDTLRAGWVQ